MRLQGDQLTLAQEQLDLGVEQHQLRLAPGLDELEKKKPLSLREKFELQKSLWRERKTIKAVAKMKKEKVKAAKKKKKEFEKKVKEKGLMGKIGRKKRKAEKKAAEAEAAEGGGGGRKSRAAAMLGRLKPHG